MEGAGQIINALNRFPGVGRIGASTAPGELLVYFKTPDHHQLAKAVLRDAVDGVRLVGISYGQPSVPDDGRTPWWGVTWEQLKAAASLPGVVDFTRDRQGVSLVAATSADRDFLQGFVREEISGQPVRWRIQGADA